MALDEVGAGTEMGGWAGEEVEWGGSERRDSGVRGRGVLKVGESGKTGKEVRVM